VLYLLLLLKSSAVQAKSWNIIKLKGVELSMAFFGQQVHVTKTANEWLFEGYEDPIINVAKDIASILNIGDIPFERFGWFYQVSCAVQVNLNNQLTRLTFSETIPAC